MQNIEISQTPNIPEPSQSPYFQESLVKPKPKGVFIKVIIFVIIVLVICVTAALATRIWDPLWNPFRPKAVKVVDKMAMTMGDLKTVHSEVNLSIVGSEEAGGGNVSMNFISDSDNTDKKNPKSTGTLTMTISGDGSSLTFAGEAKTIGEIFYFKIIAFPFFLEQELKQEGFDLKNWKGQWIKIDPESLKDFLKNMFSALGLPSDIDIDEMLEKSEQSQKEMAKKFEKLFEGKRLYLVKKELPDEKIEGKPVYHYILTLNKTELKNMIPDLAIIYVDMIKEMMPADYPLTEEDIYQAKKEFRDSLNEAFDEFFKKFGDIDCEVWIDKKEYLLYKAKIEKNIDLKKISTYSEGIISLVIDINFSKFNQSVNIKEPKESKDIMEIIMPIIESSLGQSRKRAKDALIMANVSQARAIAEMINMDFNYSYENLCTEPPTKKFNKNAPSYGSQLSTIENDIKEAQGGTLNLVCLDSKDSYCIVVDLISTDKGKYCVDSSGIAKEIAENQTCLGSGTSNNPYKCP